MVIVTGPPFSAKGQKVAAVRQPGDVVLDTTPIWKTFASPSPGDVRSIDDAAIANAMKRKGLERAVEQGRDGYVILAARDPAKLSKWLAAAGQAKALLVTEPHKTLISRARAHGPECEELLTAWENFAEDQEFMDLVDSWDAAEGNRAMEIDSTYRELLESFQFRDDETGEMLQRRCMTVECELRADDTRNPRAVTGVAVVYGDHANVWGWKESIRAGALTLPKKKSNLTMQHDRALPVGLLEWEDSSDALRFRSDLTEGSALSDEALARIAGGTVRGASLEFVIDKYEDDIPHKSSEITGARVIRLSLVDDGAYPKSKIKAAKRADCGCKSTLRSQDELIEAIAARVHDGLDLDAIVARVRKTMPADAGWSPAVMATAPAPTRRSLVGLDLI